MIQTIQIKGSRYVVMPEGQYQRLLKRASGKVVESQAAALPPADKRGRRPAAATIEAMIAQDVYNARRKAGMTQAELAQAADVRIETISRIEHGKQLPGTRTLRRLSQALGVDL